MFNQDELNRVKQQYDAFRASQATATVPKPTPKKKGGRGGTLTSLISEGGAFGGAAAGAAAGSVVPVLGTVFGGILGGIGGAFAGRLAENKVRDNRFGVGDAAKEAALTGVLGAPGRALKYGAKASMALKGSAGLSDALKAGATAADAPGIISSTLKNKVANVASNVRNDAALKNFKLNDSNWISAFQKKVGEDPGAFASRMGFATATPKQVAKKFYNPLQETYTAHLQQVPAITKGDLATALKTRVSEYAKSDVAEVRAMGQKLKKASDDLVKRLPDNISALDARAKKTAFQSAVDEKLTDTAGKLSNNTNKQIADVFRSLINDKADAAGIKIDPTSLPIPGSKATTLRELGTELRGIKEFSDKAAVKQNVGRGKNPFGLTPLLAGAAGGGAFGPGGAVGLATITGIGNSQAGRKAEYGLAKALSKTGTKTANPVRTGLGIGIRGATAASLANALTGAGQSSPFDPSMSASTQMNNPNSIAAIAPTTTGISGLSQIDANMSTGNNPLSLENLQASIQQILANGGSLKDAQEFVGLAEALQKLNPSGNAKTSFSDSAIKNITDVQSGIQQLQGLRDQVSDTAGGPIAGRVRGLNPFDTKFQTQQANINRVRQIVGKALEGGVLRKEDEEKYKKILPVMTDTPQVAQAKIDAIMQQLQNNLQQYVQFQSQTGKGAGQLPTDLAGALAASGY